MQLGLSFSFLLPDVLYQCTLYDEGSANVSEDLGERGWLPQKQQLETMAAAAMVSVLASKQHYVCCLDSWYMTEWGAARFVSERRTFVNNQFKPEE